jgi:hypothetical protein
MSSSAIVDGKVEEAVGGTGEDLEFRECGVGIVPAKAARTRTRYERLFRPIDLDLYRGTRWCGSRLLGRHRR